MGEHMHLIWPGKSTSTTRRLPCGASCQKLISRAWSWLMASPIWISTSLQSRPQRPILASTSSPSLYSKLTKRTAAWYPTLSFGEWSSPQSAFRSFRRWQSCTTLGWISMTCWGCLTLRFSLRKLRMRLFQVTTKPWVRWELWRATWIARTSERPYTSLTMSSHTHRTPWIKRSKTTINGTMRAQGGFKIFCTSTATGPFTSSGTQTVRAPCTEFEHGWRAWDGKWRRTGPPTSTQQGRPLAILSVSATTPW